ncbi:MULTISPECIES: hypothetical protein [Nocardia]|uniref:hypothetical protein n=1 Tax=Nocardia TaxID=1817 RepID=UPI0018957C31|nr:MULTISPECIES: hypothetical protein [Nocardia]MBF6348248.1 hypothetical protein [Nocardia flavorosea]
MRTANTSPDSTLPRKNRRPSRGCAWWPAVLSAIALLITGCSAGQEAQTAEQAPAINGTNGSVGAIDLENVYLHAEVADQPSPIYTDVRLAFTAVNTSQTESDRLVEIESPAAESVAIQGPGPALELGPQSSLAAGEPVQNLDPETAPDQPITVAVTMKDPGASPGLTFPFDFTFEKAGTVRLTVPFDVWTPGESQPTERPLPPSVTP